MIVDGKRTAGAARYEADICIVGAGPAGIAIAREFVNTPQSVVLLEAGGFDLSSESQEFYEGDSVGHPYPPLHICRKRILGGTTSVWGGWCHELNECDFERRDWLRFSGWPISKHDLNSHYRRARELCGVCDTSLDAPAVDSPAGDAFNPMHFEIAPTRFGSHYRKELAHARNVTVIINANVLELVLNTQRTAVGSARVQSVFGINYAVAARCFVLAAGGIENARLLLASHGSGSIGIGNEYDLVGRFFSDHLHFLDKDLQVTDPSVVSFFRPRSQGSCVIRRGLALSKETCQFEQLFGFAATGHNPRDPHDVVAPASGQESYRSLTLIGRALAKGRVPKDLPLHVRNVSSDMRSALTLVLRRAWEPSWRGAQLGIRAEQQPNPNSRILLSSKTDRFGSPLVQLDWRPTSDDFRSAHRAYALLRQSLVPGTRPLDALELGELAVVGASHHIGTTRMSQGPRCGVVDRQCRVHSVGNLWIAGSSVFPTAGWAPPTLTIVALALRLVGALKKSLEAERS